MLVRDTGQESSSKNKEGNIFITKEKVGREEEIREGGKKGRDNEGREGRDKRNLGKTATFYLRLSFSASG